MKQRLNKSWLSKRYWKEELSSREIGKLLNCSHEKVLYWMKKLGIPRRSKYSKRTCLKISRLKQGEKNSNWKGGEVVDGHGYILVLSKDHPNKNYSGYVRRSHLVAEKALGRYLKKGEMTHHINEDRKDDRNENILICTVGYHNTIHCKMRRLCVLYFNHCYDTVE